MVLGTEKVGDIGEQDIETMFETNVLGLIAITQHFVRGGSVPRGRLPAPFLLTSPSSQYSKSKSRVTLLTSVPSVSSAVILGDVDLFR